MSADSRDAQARADPVAVADENRRLRRLRFMADLTSAELMQSTLTLDEARAAVERLRSAALALFPDSEATFDLIYRTRLERIIRERFGDAARERAH